MIQNNKSEPSKMQLLNREEFRNKVLKSTNNKCVFCNTDAVDAHHIIERKLWPDEGYYFENGCSVCEFHHKLAERNIITPHQCRKAMGHNKTIEPFDDNEDHNKWGDVLKVKEHFDGWIKYPSTMYFDFSPSIDADETFDINNFLDCPIVLTVKMDGSNMTMTKDHIAARNGWCANHPSFDMAKAEHAKMKHLIADNHQIFGEWLYAKHSIEYDNLDGYFQVFSIYDKNIHEFLSWDETKEIANSLGFITVPVVRECFCFYPKIMMYDIIDTAQEVIDSGHEGLVIRSAYSFHYSQFKERLAKYVRPHHVQTDEHWSKQSVVRNKLK